MFPIQRNGGLISAVSLQKSTFTYLLIVQLSKLFKPTLGLCDQKRSEQYFTAIFQRIKPPIQCGSCCDARRFITVY